MDLSSILHPKLEGDDFRFDREHIQQIKSFTLQIFKKYPEIDIKFDEYRDGEYAIQYINGRKQGIGSCDPRNSFFHCHLLCMKFRVQSIETRDLNYACRIKERKMDDFSMQHENNENVTVIIISGRVDSATSETMDVELTKLIHTEKKVVLDLKLVEFLSSAGVRAIVKALKTAKKSNHTIKLASIPDHIADVLQTLGMMEIMQVYPSVEEAVASF